MGLDDRFKHIGHFRLLFLSGDSTPPNGSHRPWRFPFGGSIGRVSSVRAGLAFCQYAVQAAGRRRLLARLPAATNDERHLDAVRRGMDLDHLPHG